MEAGAFRRSSKSCLSILLDGAATSDSAKPRRSCATSTSGSGDGIALSSGSNGNAGLSVLLSCDAAASQLNKTDRPAFPLLPDDSAMPSPDPLVEVAQLRRGFAESEVAAPSNKIDRQLFDDLRKAPASITTRQFPRSTSEPGKRLRCNASPRLFPIREAEAQELTLARARDRTFRLVD